MSGTMGRLVPGLRRINIRQGETRVSDDPGVVLTTVLGSCIAVCLHDPVGRVGGINHFLLAEPGSADVDTASLPQYGVYAMEVLVNAMLAMGATRPNLRARLYGGASLSDGFHTIGATNAACARRFLAAQRIPLIGQDVGGCAARRVQFRPALGLARCRTAAGTPAERRAPGPFPPAPEPEMRCETEFFR